MGLFLVTGSKNKFSEFKSAIPEIEQLDIDLVEIQELDPHEVIKAKLIEGLKHKQAGLVVEDTSLFFEALNGFPGPLIKWFQKATGFQLLWEIADKLGNTRVKAKTIIGYAEDPDKIEFFEGAIDGEIVSPRGDAGFGWDVIFQPKGHEKTFAEMTMEEKNSISMRKIAINKLKERIEK